MTARNAHAEVSIDAPIDVVWQAMIDLDRYGEWNPFIVRVDRPAGPRPQVGDDLVLHVRWQSGRGVKTRERIVRLDEPRTDDGARRATLEYEFLGPLAALGMARGRRLQSLEQLAGGPTHYTTHERLHGWLVRLAPLAKVRDGFERHGRALKARAESLAQPR